MAIQSQPSRIPEPFAGSGTKNTIPATNATPSASQAASWASGFPPECSQPISAGGCPVPRNDVNGALNQLSQEYSFRQDGGIWEWSALADYDVQRVVRGSDGLLYWSVAQSGPGIAAGAQNPTTDDGTYWQAMPMDDANVVHKTGAETISGKKTLSTTVQVIGEKYNIDPNTGDNGVKNPDNDAALLLWSGGSIGDGTQGAKLVLAGQTYGTANSGNTDDNGGFVIQVNDGSNINRLRGLPANGELLWEGHCVSVGRGSSWGAFARTLGVTRANAGSLNKNVGYGAILSSDGKYLGSITCYISTNYTELGLFSYKTSDTDSSAGLSLRYNNTNNDRSFLPTPSNTISLGASAYRWTQLYAATATINTSDARLKTAPEAVPDEVLDAWGEVGFVQFQMLDSVAEKGADKARLHSGLIAQRIDEAFKAHGLDASRYGLFCYDEWEEEPERIGEDGSIEREAIPAGNRYSLRYEEALCMEAAYQRRRADRAEARIAALEERLGAIEAKLG